MYSIQEFIVKLTLFISNTLLPFLFGLALLFFIYNVFRLFILKSSENEAKESAKRFALYSIAAFVFLVSIWGIVNLLVNGLGLNGGYDVVPDYMMNSTGGEGGSGGWWFSIDFYEDPNAGAPSDCINGGPC
ncbi:hypothetical protein H6789_03145 [Candidatus Nomurabacteria bacterium]|nr:hypothetical protein [Candidatus Nomurabacteria bacterium]